MAKTAFFRILSEVVGTQYERDARARTIAWAHINYYCAIFFQKIYYSILLLNLTTVSMCRLASKRGPSIELNHRINYSMILLLFIPLNLWLTCRMRVWG